MVRQYVSMEVSEGNHIKYSTLRCLLSHTMLDLVRCC